MQPNDWQTLQQKSRVAAIEKVVATPRIDEIRATILKSFQELSAQAFDAYDTTPTIKYIAQRLQNDRANDWSDALLESGSPPPGVKPFNLVAADIVIGQVAGIFCGTHPGEQELAFTRHIRNTIRYHSQDFLEFSQPLVEGKDLTKAMLVATLRQRIADYQSHPERLISFSQWEREILQKRTAENGRFADVWREPYRRPRVFIHDSAAYELLRRVDHRSYLDLLDSLPICDLVYDILHEANRSASVSDLCAMLGDVHSAFDEDSQWKKGKYAVFYILNHLGEKLFAEISDDGSLNDCFESYLALILPALRSRADYVPLAYAWMQHLLLFGQRRRHASNIQDLDTRAALTQIATTLASALPPLGNPIQWITEELDVWRSGRVYTILAIELSRSTVNNQFIVKIVEQVILQGLVLPIGMERLQERPNVFEWCVMASAISRIPQTATWFQQLWEKMYWQRSQARGHRRMRIDSATSAQVIVWWSIAGLAGLKPASVEARALWIVLESAARESCLTDAYHVHNDLWLPILRLLGAILPVTFPEDPARGQPGSLDDFLSRWYAVTREFALLVVTLRHNKVNPARLVAAGITYELLNLIVEDSKALNRTLLSPEDSKLIGDLAAEIATL